MRFGWEGGFEVKGHEIALHDAPRFDNPYSQSAFLSSEVAIQRGEETLVLCLEQPSTPDVQKH
jgi:hypothetical protein